MLTHERAMHFACIRLWYNLVKYMDNFSNTPQQPSVSPTKKPSLFRRVVDDLKYYVDYARNSNEYVPLARQVNSASIER